MVRVLHLFEISVKAKVTQIVINQSINQSIYNRLVKKFRADKTQQ